MSTASPSSVRVIIDNEINLFRPLLERMLQNHTREQEQRLRQERAAHVSEVANLRAHISQLQVQNNVKDTELLSVHHQNERLETDKTNLEKEIDDAKEENVSLLAEVEALNKVIIKNAKDAEEERNKLEAALLEARTLKENMKDARRLMKKATFLLKGVCVPDADASTSSSSIRRPPTRRRCDAGRRRTVPTRSRSG